jgi:hypothetical protein
MILALGFDIKKIPEISGITCAVLKPLLGFAIVDHQRYSDIRIRRNID